jgi:carbamoyl-phosphate synthase large subunit
MGSSRSKARRPVVAITGLEGRDNPYPGAAVARALREARGDDIVLIGLAYEPTLTSAFRRDLFDRVYLTPLPGDPAAVLLRRLQEIHSIEHLDVLIPSLDSELPLYAGHKDELAAAGIRMLIPSARAVKQRYKQRLPAWAAQHGIACPRTEVITDPRTFWRQPDWTFPCWIKGSLADAVRVTHQAEAEAAFWRMVSLWGYPVLAQMPVIGEEFDVCAVARRGGDAVGMITIQKTVLSSAGKAIGARVVEDEHAHAAAQRVMHALEWEGPLELELMRETSSGKFHLIEINARFPAWVGASAGMGLNLPDLALRLALEETLPEPRKARTGAMFLRTSHTTLSDASALAALLADGRLEHQP